MWASLFLLPAFAFAQGTGTIHGTVIDPAGLMVAGAKVAAVLDQRGTTRAAETDTQGGFVLPLLPVGEYSIRVEAAGFKVFAQSGVGLTSNQNVRIDARLEVGSVTESVRITAEAPLIDSRSSQLGTLLDGRRILELPTNGRNVISLLELLPGAATVSAPQTFTGDRSGPTVSISGSRNNENLFLFDGAQFNAVFRNTGLNYPPPDALQEVKVLSNAYNAEYGRNAGAVLNVITKSGTNQVHGSAWEFLRNHTLNARNFFAPSEKPQLIQNQFGAAGGGPVRKDKFFLFGSYEGLRVRPASLSGAAFPLTVAERAGTFASAIRDPSNNNLPFAGNQIPAARFDPVAKNVLAPNIMPLPNRADGQLVQATPQPQNNTMFLVRADYNLSRHTIDARYNYNLATQRSSAGDIPAYLPLDNRATVQSVTVGDTFNWRPTLLNQFRIGFNRVNSSIANLNATSLGDLGGNFPLFGPKIPPSLAITGRVTLGNGSSVDAIIVNESREISDSLTYTAGRHSIKSGFDLLNLRYLNRSYFQTMGDFSFTGSLSGNPAADFVLGRPATVTVASPVLEQAGRQTNLYFFAQDDWRIHPRLTLNLGLRYELPFNWVHPQDFWGTLRPGQQSQVVKTAPKGLVFPGDAGVPRGMFPTDRNNFAPRIGFAWDPFGGGRTSVRGAYGIFYETINSDIIQNTGQPFRYTFTFNAPFSLTDPLRGQPAIPFSVNLSNPVFTGLQQIFYADPNLRSPYVQHLNLNVQREVVKGLAVQVGYVGKLGRKMLIGWSPNPAVFAPGATLANINQRRLDPSFGGNSEISSRSTSSYHSMQTEVNKRFSHGFSLQGTYTLSKSIDMFSGNSLGAGIPNIFNFRTQVGRSDFDSKHIAALSWIWDLPRLQKMPLAVRLAAGGWQVNGLVTTRTGRPLNPLNGEDVALSGTPNQRPDVVGNPALSSDRSKDDRILAWFNRAAFARPVNGVFGNAGRNSLEGPTSTTTNLGIFKSFAIPWRERAKVQFRSEFFNALNAVNLGNPNVTLNAGTRMGRITSASSGRVIQFALKLLW